MTWTLKKKFLKISETKSWFFEKIKQVNEALARLIIKRKRTQVNKIRNERGEITTETIESQRIVRIK